MSLFCVTQKVVFCQICVERNSQILLAVRHKIRLRNYPLISSKSRLFFSPRLTTRESLSVRYDIGEIY